ncbi:low-specificity L-threonine aldolase [Amylibacter sp. SFDW26]|uniref:low-specificity L-threonine aldolase n=1 Tax=Amylibacter sp. SFDW26 TaxID=2652722 RepID=UPI001262875D|nr:low-specificity L-threonine aldolase [Amylibacter sp. SFDW26]KAB7615836.1 low-specificity L-threonine aldolase [Amylibacter sp. SFDW26]
MSTYSGMNATSGVNTICDFRSDTITRPDVAMREAMASAVVGDDVYGDDPTVNHLEERLADMLGKEAAVFFPTGTQSNLAAIMAHCGRGDEIIVGNEYHTFCDEAAGASVLAGISLNPVKTEMGGEVSPDSIAAAIKEDDPHYARSRLLCLENTVSGRAIPIQTINTSAKVAKDAGLSVHLDGARFFNAITALKCSPKELADCADSISLCMSKGLGTPVGSVLVGSHALTAQARRNRKILGGSMRQSGILAAAALYALDHNIETLVQDHNRAERLANALTTLDVGAVVHNSNMVFFTPAPEHHKTLYAHMAKTGVVIGGQSPTIRMVMHRDISDDALDLAIQSFQSYYA